MPKKKTLEEVIVQFRSAHGDRYDYSQVCYEGAARKVDVVCRHHGIFKIAPGHHINGVGCAKCSFEKSKFTLSQFIKEAKDVNGDRYDYSRIPDPFPGTVAKLPIRCISHDLWFEQAANAHLKGHTGCRECKSEVQRGPAASRGEKTSIEVATAMFIERANQKHCNRYDYSKTVYQKTNGEIEISCPEHGPFWQTPSNHLKGNGCPACASLAKNSNTFKKKCVELRINYHRALKRRQACMSEEKILQDGYVRSERITRTSIEVNGIFYPNIVEACRILQPIASGTTILRWIEGGMSPEDAFEKIPNPGYANGIIYRITQISTGKQYVGLTIMDIDERWKYHQEQAIAGHVKSGNSLHHAIREHGPSDFSIDSIDFGQSKSDLEDKEIYWIDKLGTLAPHGFNLNKGGASGGSTPIPTIVDDKQFNSRKAAIKYIAESRDISEHAAAARLRSGRINVRKPSPIGQSLVKTKEYKAWSAMKDAISPNSKSFIPGIDLHEAWRCNFNAWLDDVGNAPSAKHRFCRHDKNKGFVPGNCSWMNLEEDIEFRRNSGQVLFGGVFPGHVLNARRKITSEKESLS